MKAPKFKSIVAMANARFSIKASAVILASSTLVSALLGIFRDRLLNSYYLDTYPTGIDAYTAAFTIPDFMFFILTSGALAVSFIPVFNQRLVNGNKKWEQLLYLFPSPDKPFDIEDVKDDALKSCIQEIERLETEDHELFSYILKTFNSEGEKIIIKEYLSVRFPRLGKKENKVNNNK